MNENLIPAIEFDMIRIGVVCLLSVSISLQGCSEPGSVTERGKKNSETTTQVGTPEQIEQAVDQWALPTEYHQIAERIQKEEFEELEIVRTHFELQVIEEVVAKHLATEFEALASSVRRLGNRFAEQISAQSDEGTNLDFYFKFIRGNGRWWRSEQQLDLNAYETLVANADWVDAVLLAIENEPPKEASKEASTARMLFSNAVKSVAIHRDLLTKETASRKKQLNELLARNQSKLVQCVPQKEMPEPPYSLLDLGFSVPSLPPKPERPKGKVMIAGATHRIESDRIFVDNKIVLIPSRHLEQFVQGWQQKPNKAVITGTFNFVENAGTTFAGHPVEIYELPPGFDQYLQELAAFKKAESLRAPKVEFYFEKERLLAEITLDAKAFYEAIRQAEDASPVTFPEALQVVKESASKLLGEQNKAIILSDVEKTNIRNTIAERIAERFKAELPTQQPGNARPDDSAKQTPENRTKTGYQAPDVPKDTQPVSGGEGTAPKAGPSSKRKNASLDPLLKVATDWKRDESGQLSIVAFHGVAVSDEAIEVLAQQHEVTRLHLANATISSRQLGQLHTLTNVVSLALWESNIKPSGVVLACEQFPKLKYLSIAATKGLSDYSAKSIGEMQQLRQLSVGYCGATDQHLAQFVRMPSLQTLNVESSKLTFGGLIKLRECESLRKLVVTGNKPSLNQRQKQGLRTALPKVTIEF